MAGDLAVVQLLSCCERQQLLCLPACLAGYGAVLKWEILRKERIFLKHPHGHLAILYINVSVADCN